VFDLAYYKTKAKYTFHKSQGDEKEKEKGKGKGKKGTMEKRNNGKMEEGKRKRKGKGKKERWKNGKMEEWKTGKLEEENRIVRDAYAIWCLPAGERLSQSGNYWRGSLLL
jgi:hypothetical protein